MVNRQIILDIAELLEREAGAIVVGFLLILLGALFFYIGIPKAEDIMIFALGLLGRSIMGSGDKQQSGGGNA